MVNSPVATDALITLIPCRHPPKPAITCSMLTIEMLEEGVKYIQGVTHIDANGVFLVSLLLTLNKFHILF